MPVSFKGESESTIREALEALDTIEPASEVHATKIELQRRQLLADLNQVRAQGALF